MFHSRYLPCPDCGASVDRAGDSRHECSPERLADYQLFGLRDEVAELETRVRDYLRTSAGRFDAWLAARQVRGEA